MYIALLICRFLVFILPIFLLHKIGRFVGFIAYYIAIKRRKIVLINLGLCFPELSVKKRKYLARKCFINLGVGFFETLICWVKPVKVLNRQNIQVTGSEYLDMAKKYNKGCIIMSGHMTPLEYMPILLSKYDKFGCVYRPHENKYINKLMKKGRQRFNHDTISRYDMRKMLKSLKNKSQVVYLLDQDMGIKNSSFIPFFNIQTATLTTMYRIAKKTNSMMVILMFHRDKNGKYHCKFYPPIDLDKFKDLTDEEISIEVAKIYNKTLEEHVRKYPDQYLWAHRRFKTRPPGEESFYKDI